MPVFDCACCARGAAACSTTPGEIGSLPSCAPHAQLRAPGAQPPLLLPAARSQDVPPDWNVFCYVHRGSGTIGGVEAREQQAVVLGPGGPFEAAAGWVALPGVAPQRLLGARRPCHAAPCRLRLRRRGRPVAAGPAGACGRPKGAPRPMHPAHPTTPPHPASLVIARAGLAARAWSSSSSPGSRSRSPSFSTAHSVRRRRRGSGASAPRTGTAPSPLHAHPPGAVRARVRAAAGALPCPASARRALPAPPRARRQ